MSVKSTLLKVGKVAASVILQRYLPGAGGFIQQAEDLLGSKTGSEKKSMAAKMALEVLTTLAKSGRLEGAAPALVEVEAAVDQIVAAMKATGELIESKEGTLTTSEGNFRVIVVGKIQ